MSITSQMDSDGLRATIAAGLPPLADLLRCNRVGIHVYDVATGDVWWDDILTDLWGVPHDATVTFDIWAAGLHPDDRAMAEERVNAALSAGHGGRYDAEYRVINRRDGSVRWVHACGSIDAPDGGPGRLMGTVHELTGRAALDTELRAAEQRAFARASEAEAVYEGAPLGIVLFDTDFRFKRINRRLAAINGLSDHDHVGKSIEEVLPPETCTVLRAMRPRLMAGEDVDGIEISGFDEQLHEQRTFIVSYSPVRDAGRHVTGFMGIVQDISERKAAEERARLLAHEVEHRAKNLIAIIHSVIRLTRADDVVQYRNTLCARIEALGRSHALLHGARDGGTDLHGLISDEFSPYCSAGTRCHASGPAVALTPEGAQSLGMVFHELATNAAKHGALSQTDGRVTVTWQTDGNALTLEWRETGGPAVSAPAHKGFGTRLLTHSLTSGLGGTIDRHWDPAGLVCTLRVPLAAILSAA